MKKLPYVCLIRSSNDSDGSRVVGFEAEEFTIGRSDEADYQTSSPGVSRLHLAVQIEFPEIFIVDLGSANGTEVSGNKVPAQQPWPYKPGEPIRLGTSKELLFIELAGKVQEGATRIRDIALSSQMAGEKTVIDNSFQLLLEEAKTKADLVLKNARSEAVTIRAKAETEAVNIIQDAKQKASSAILKAKEKAEEIVSQTYEQVPLIKKQIEEDAQKMRDTFQYAADEIRLQAEVTAGKIREEAKERGVLIVEEHQKKAEKILSEARSATSSVKVDAQKEAETILKKAETQALEARTSAEMKAGAILKETQARCTIMLRASEEEVDRILNEARQASETIRIGIQKDYDEARLRGQKKADQILNEALAKEKEIINETKEKNEKILKDAQEKVASQLEEVAKEKVRVLDRAHEEAQSIKNNMIEDTRTQIRESEAKLNLLKKELKHQEEENNKFNADSTVAQKTLQDRLKELENQLRIRNEGQEQEFKVRREELEGQYQSQKESLENQFQTQHENLESQTRSQIKALQTRLQSETKILQIRFEELSENLRVEKEDLERAARERDKVDEEKKVSLEILKKTNDEIGEAEKQKNQILSRLSKLEKEAQKEFDEAKAKATEAFNVKVKQEEQYIANLRLNEMTESKRRRLELDKRDEMLREHRIVETARNLEILLESKFKFQAGSIEKGQLFSELKSVVTKVFKDSMRSKESDENLGQTESDVVVQKKKSQKKRALMLTGTALFVLLFLYFNNDSTKSERSPASEMYEKMRKEREKPPFNPLQTADFKGSYTEDIVYTTGYLNFKLDPDKQKQWIVDLNKFFIDELGIGENAIIKFGSLESGLTLELKKMRDEVDPRKEKEGVKKMADYEEKTVEQMKEILGSEKKYERFKQFEKNYFTDVGSRTL